MTTRHLTILFVVLLGGLSSVHLLPKQLSFQPIGVEQELPEFLGEWWGHDVQVSQKERDVLGPDTDFLRKQYDSARGASIFTSVVLAGQDMMTSIHRPERCLHAQGWEFGSPEKRIVDIPNMGKLEVTRLVNHKSAKTTDGQTVTVSNVCYYWFTGSKDTTPSHLERVYLDSRDRLFGGFVQRWAMIMVNADITKPFVKFGRDEPETEALLQDFVKKLVPKLHKESVKLK